MEQQLSSVLGSARFAALVVRKDLVRRIVSTVVNASERSLPPELSPLKAPAGSFRTRENSGGFALSKDNYSRYLAYTEALAAIDLTKLVPIYERYYSLFQSAYRDLGTTGYFNDVLVAAIDNVLATPKAKDPIALTQYGAHFKFSDPALEGLSASQKLLLRAGSLNSSIVKDKLRELRERLAHLKE